MKNDIILRPHYVDHILEVIDQGMMIVLVGQRRVGKTYILMQYTRKKDFRAIK